MQGLQKPVRRFFIFPATNEVEGPFELLELAGLLKDGLITGETQTLVEGEEQWLPFQERTEFNLAREISHEAIALHAKEKAEAKVSSFSPRKLLIFGSIMITPVFLFVLYRIVRLYIGYHLGHDTTAPASDLAPPDGS